MIDLMLYAALAVVAVAGVAILFVGGWLIHNLTSSYEQAEKEKQV